MSALILSLLVVTAAPTGGELAPGFHSHAALLEPGRVTVGAFSPTRVGLSESLELVVYPWTMPLLPNAGLRSAVLARDGLHLTVGLGAHVPTFPLRLIAREGAGGLLPPDAEVPFMLAFDPELSASVDVGPALYFEVHAGGRGVLGANGRLPLIELPFLLPRVAPYVGGWGVSAGGRAGGQLYGPVGFRVGIDAFAGPVEGARWALEPEAALLVSFGRTLRLTAGTRLFVGEVPYGVYWSTPLPFVDVELGLDLARAAPAR